MVIQITNAVFGGTPKHIQEYENPVFSGFLVNSLNVLVHSLKACALHAP
jgi:hypothetical protein